MQVYAGGVFEAFFDLKSPPPGGLFVIALLGHASLVVPWETLELQANASLGHASASRACPNDCLWHSWRVDAQASPRACLKSRMRRGSNILTFGWKYV
jgi:hypothetical protein